MLPNVYRLLGRQRRQPPAPIIDRYRMATPACTCSSPVCPLHPIEVVGVAELRRRIGA